MKLYLLLTQSIFDQLIKLGIFACWVRIVQFDGSETIFLAVLCSFAGQNWSVWPTVTTSFCARFCRPTLVLLGLLQVPLFVSTTVLSETAAICKKQGV